MKTTILILCFSLLGCLRAKKSPFDINGGSPIMALAVLSFSSSGSSGSDSFSYDKSSVTITKGYVMADLTPTIVGTISSFSSSPALPNGVSINSTTGVISGTPIANQAETSYKISGKGTSGSPTADIKITITSDPPSNLSYNGTSSGMATGSTSSALLFRRTIAASVAPTITGSATFSISPSLPSGLSLNSSSGTISGTPTVSQVAGNYTVTATNTYGSIQITLSITVLPVIYAATAGGLSISIDGGNNFINVNTTNFTGLCNPNSVFVDSNGVIYTANGQYCNGGNDNIYVSSNNGTSFTALLFLGSAQTHAVYSSGTGAIYAGTAATGFYYSTNNGANFTNITTATTPSVGTNWIGDIFVEGSNLYLANWFSSPSAVSISTNGWATINNRNNANSSLTTNGVFGIFAVGANVYAATASGLYISTNSGNNFAISGMTSFANNVNVVSGTIYVASGTGIYISTNGGTGFVNKTFANSSLPSDTVNKLFVYQDGTIYAATSSGVGISSDGGNSFVTRNTSNGIGNANIRSIFVR